MPEYTGRVWLPASSCVVPAAVVVEFSCRRPRRPRMLKPSSVSTKSGSKDQMNSRSTPRVCALSALMFWFRIREMGP